MTTKTRPTPKAETVSTGLSPNKEKILKLLAKGKPITYKDVEKATGMYKNLTALMRSGHAGSLVELGYATEKEVEEDGRTKLTFVITAAGRKAAAKL